MNPVIKLANKFNIKYSQHIIDPKKQLVNAVGYIVPSGTSVQDVQNKLKEKGFNLKIDGIWGPESYGELIKYQQKFNLPVEGKLNGPTVEHMGLL